MVKAVSRLGGPAKGGAMAARLGVKGGVKKSFGGGGIVGDARQRIIQANRVKTGDARDKLAEKAKTMDARQKLEKIRNLKEGKLEVKKVGGITVTKKIDGKISLSTKGGTAAGPADVKKSPSFKEVKQIGRLTKTVSSSGQVTLSSKSGAGGGVTSSGMRSGAGGVPAKGQEKGQVQSRGRSEGGRPEGGRPAGGAGSVLRGTVGAARGEQKENVRRNVGGLTRDIDRLDDELLNARVDPFLLKRTIENSRTRSAGGSRSPVRGGPGQVRRLSDKYSERRARSRSPMGRDRSPLRARSPVRGVAGRGYDYDDPRAMLERDQELFKRRQREQELRTSQTDMSRDRTMASRLEGPGGAVGVSPLQGTKIVIQNLQTSVTQEDILELFGDIGALRRAKLVNPGHAEVTFVNHGDAVKAVEIYHNRQLDGKPMKCQLVGANNPVASGGATMKLPPSLLSKRREGAGSAPPPDIESIHRALFFNKKYVGKKPLFTITMPKKSKDEERW